MEAGFLIMKDQVIQHLSSRDHILQSIIAEVDWPEVTSTCNVFHDLMSCVIEQQIHYRSTKKTFIKLLTKASLAELTVDNFEEFEEQALGDMKLSMKKYETITELVEFFQNQSADWQQMNDATVHKTLRNIPGIGKWTVDMILLYTLERPNVFPVQDYHLKQLITQLYAIDSKRITSEMKNIAKSWTPYRSFGVKYLFAWKEINKRSKP